MQKPKGMQGPDMIIFWKFINNILRVHYSLNMNTWELAGFQFSLIFWIIMHSFHLMYFEKLKSGLALD